MNEHTLTVDKKERLREAAPRDRVRDFWLLLRKYGARHAQALRLSQPITRPRGQPQARKPVAALFYLRLTNYLLIVMFAVSFLWDFPSVSVQLGGHSLALDGLLRITSVSGLIGFLTNWLAITMLFHPRQRRPIFGQGLIPAQRKRVIEQLAQTIYKNLINPQTILQKIEKSGLLVRYRQTALQIIRDVMEDPDFRDELKLLIISSVEQMVAAKGTRQEFARLIVEKLEQSIKQAKGLKASLLWGSLRIFRLFKEDELQNMIDTAIRELPQSLDPLLDQIEEFLDTLPKTIEAHSAEIERWIMEAVPSFVEQFDVYDLLTSNLRKLDEERLEKLLKNDTSNDQFNYIKDLGGILGFFGGLVIWQPVLALITFGSLGLSLWLLDEALLRVRQRSQVSPIERTEEQGVVS